MSRTKGALNKSTTTKISCGENNNNKKEFSRKCPKCNETITYKTKASLRYAIKKKSLCKGCMAGGSRTASLENNGSLVYDINTMRWKLTCPECGKIAISRWKTNCVICRRCHPQKNSGSAPKGNIYWNEFTEAAISEYLKSETQEQRDDIYNTKLKFSFEKLVENIFNTFKFSYFEVGPDDIMKECVGHLFQQLPKFNPDRGSKSYSYFSIVAKNWLIALNNFNYKHNNIHESIDEQTNEKTNSDDNSHHNNTVIKQLTCEDKYEKNEATNEFFDGMISFYENNMNVIFKKKYEQDIANAVIELFRRRQSLDMDSNKKALYLYIREISNCNTQKITKIINKMRKYYFEIKNDWDNGKEFSLCDE